MSEFSESYHLKSNCTDDGVALLKRAKLQGFIFPSTGGWVTILPEGAPFALNQGLLDANEGILLHFLNAEDHGWGFELYRRASPLAMYSCVWEDEVQVELPLDVQSFERELGPVLTSLGEETLRRVLKPPSIDDLLETNPAATFAGALGLVHFQWLSYEYFARDQSEGKNNFPEAIFVQKQ